MNRRALLTGASVAFIARRAFAQPGGIGCPLGAQPLVYGPSGGIGYGSPPGPGCAPGGPPSLDLSLLSATLDPSITFTRSTTATDGLYTDAAGSSFNSFAINAPLASVAKGLLIEEVRTNFLLNSGAPVTQTTASLAIGTYCLWTIGTGTATSSAVTATGTGFGATAAGVPNVFVLTVAGTVLITVAGSLTRFQLEKSAFPTTYIPTVATTVLKQADLGVLPTSTWYNAAAGTLLVDFFQPQLNAISVDLPCLYTDASNMFDLRVTNATVALLPFVANVSTASVTAAGSVTANVTQRAAFSYVFATNALSLCLNGGTVATGVASSLPTSAQIRMGLSRTLQQDGFVRRLRYWPRALSAAEMRSVTT